MQFLNIQKLGPEVSENKKSLYKICNIKLYCYIFATNKFIMLEEIEKEYREIFSRERITQRAINKAAFLLLKWKLVTGYISDKSNPFLDYTDILDQEIKPTL